MSSAKLTVVVRVRPLSDVEKEKRHFQCVFQLDKQRLLLVDPEKYENNILRQNRQHERQFTFDAAFGPNSSQMDIHEASTSPLVDTVVSGYNATVFAYGATGSGKTFTMIGTKDRPGLMSLLTQSLYQKITDEYQVQLSYLEIYNEVIRDLLSPSGAMLDLMEDDKGNIRVPGLSTVRAPNLSRIMQILQEGNLRRTQEATEANMTSSRSHALLQVSLLKNNRPYSKLFLIDLAGSERASNTNNRGQRLKEGAAINRSLLALGNVINSLSSNVKGRYVNYRDSKLTRLLKDSLGGNARTCMIAHVTAASGHFEETYNTLVYASRAKNITNKVTRNRPASADQPYTEVMREMRQELERRTIPHAASTNQIDKTSSTNDRYRYSVRWNGSTSTNGTAKGEKRDFSSLFNQLKAQYVTLSDKQQKLRERLMKANQDAYEVEMSRTSKLAIIHAWEKHNQEDKAADSINRLKKDVAELDEQLNGMVEIRQKLERALRKGQETAKSVETRLRSLASSKEQNELIDLVVRMDNIQAERISAVNDLAIQSLIMEKTDNTMSKLSKYEMLAEKLIEGRMDDKDRERLEQEYRIVKNQFHYHLIPLKNIQSVVSWNSLLLPKLNSSLSSSEDSDRASNRRAKKRESVQLPYIVKGRERERDSGSSSYESRSDRHDSLNSNNLPSIL
ncbi:Kinesin motor domain-containing protein [Trichostrongylus colubriformis]|uniref:Kinesin-like protein n=1 Tax=Trichostrongylus colubriformis TaxID=6319 RepID=A0AAN8IU96_TRICO